MQFIELTSLLLTFSEKWSGSKEALVVIFNIVAGRSDADLDQFAFIPSARMYAGY